jgi:hypothetical protein
MHSPPAGTPFESTKGENIPVKKKKRGRSLMDPSPFAVMSHPFGATLKEWSYGVQVNCGNDWTREAIDLAIQHGPHPTACLPEALEVFAEDIAYQVEAGFTELVFWDDIKDDLPANFKCSPVALVPQVNRRGRIILNLSFPVRRPPEPGSGKRRRMGPVLQESVNDTSERLAPSHPVKELGKVLPRLFEFMASTPEAEEIRFSKIDLSDGFWRMVVAPEHKWNFCYVMPDPPGSPIRIVVPSALQMGWTESPAYFCAATETGRDIIQWLIDSNADLPPHPMEHYLIPPEEDEPRSQQSAAEPEHVNLSVYVDDYILAVVENFERTLFRRVSRAALYGIHSIFPPPHISGHVGGKDPISEKKLLKDDARLLVLKEILGFLMDGVLRTVQLPEGKMKKIIAEIDRILRKVTIPLSRFQSIVGKLRHAAQILPASKGIFTPLNAALRGDPKIVGLGQNSDVRHALLDLKALVVSLAGRPTHVSELVLYEPSAIGTVDASSFGAGGIWLCKWGLFPPTVWRLEWPADIFASYKEKRLTNSDLEMAGLVLHFLVLERLTKMFRIHTEIYSDNTPTVSWSTKMAAKATTPIAGRLIRALALRQRVVESALPAVKHWPGTLNTHADVASRSFQVFEHGPLKGTPSVSDSDFLTSFAFTFPLPPQKTLWQLVPPPPELSSNVISTLRGTRSRMQQWMTPPVPLTGTTGANTWLSRSSTTLTCENSGTENDCRCSWHSLPGPAQAFLAMEPRSAPLPLKLLSATSPKRSYWPDIPTPGP